MRATEPSPLNSEVIHRNRRASLRLCGLTASQASFRLPVRISQTSSIGTESSHLLTSCPRKRADAPMRPDRRRAAFTAPLLREPRTL